MERYLIRQRVEDELLRKEGWPTYSNRPADKGGPTKGGITLKTLEDWRGRRVSILELQELPESEARSIYRLRYIKPWEFVPDDELFAACVDWAVTSWHDDPARALQRKLGIRVDGLLGKETRDAVIAYHDPLVLRNALVGARVRFYTDLALDDPKLLELIRGHSDLQLRNLRGWLNRATSFLA